MLLQFVFLLHFFLLLFPLSFSSGVSSYYPTVLFIVLLSLLSPFRDHLLFSLPSPHNTSSFYSTPHPLRPPLPPAPLSPHDQLFHQLHFPPYDHLLLPLHFPLYDHLLLPVHFPATTTSSHSTSPSATTSSSSRSLAKAPRWRRWSEPRGRGGGDG